MIEIWGNYRWVRLQRPNQRANRFIKYLALDHLKLLERMPASEQPPNYQTLLRTLKQQRAASRHLFQSKVTLKSGSTKLVWAKSCAQVSSFEARMKEVAKSRPPAERAGDEAIYFFYSWFSGATHGSPFSLTECMAASPTGWRARRQPERRPTAPLAAAASCLCDTVVFVCDDLSLPLLSRAQSLDAEIRNLGRLPTR